MPYLSAGAPIGFILPTRTEVVLTPSVSTVPGTAVHGFGAQAAVIQALGGGISVGAYLAWGYLPSAYQPMHPRNVGGGVGLLFSDPHAQ